MPQHYNPNSGSALLPGDTVSNRQEDGQPMPVTLSAANLAVHRGSTGGTATFGVSLPVKPTANVVVNSAVAWQSGGDVTISGGASLTFTTANFATPQNVTVSAPAPQVYYDAANRPNVVKADGNALVRVTATGTDSPPFAPAQVNVQVVA